MSASVIGCWVIKTDLYQEAELEQVLPYNVIEGTRAFSTSSENKVEGKMREAQKW